MLGATAEECRESLPGERAERVARLSGTQIEFTKLLPFSPCLKHWSSPSVVGKGRVVRECEPVEKRVEVGGGWRAGPKA
jgi:hypothetical protein